MLVETTHKPTDIHQAAAIFSSILFNTQKLCPAQYVPCRLVNLIDHIYGCPGFYYSEQVLEVTECQCRLLGNLKDYLDTGLFLDHRKMRLRIAREAAGKDFLNLYCYTGTATVHAAVGGATSTTSVDLSNTYLGWARKNLALNGLVERKHRLEQSDCLQWLKQDIRQYELIFKDPPTFSNSKRKRGVFDVQEAHVELITLAMARLKRDGVLYFSNNFRRFQLAEVLMKKFNVEEITGATVDQDFQRRPKMHRCWRLTWL